MTTTKRKGFLNDTIEVGMDWFLLALAVIAYDDVPTSWDAVQALIALVEIVLALHIVVRWVRHE